jgi:hypothetical protein
MHNIYAKIMQNEVNIMPQVLLATKNPEEMLIFTTNVAMQQKSVDSILGKRYCALHQMHKRIEPVD